MLASGPLTYNVNTLGLLNYVYITFLIFRPVWTGGTFFLFVSPFFVFTPFFDCNAFQTRISFAPISPAHIVFTVLGGLTKCNFTRLSARLVANSMLLTNEAVKLNS